MSEGKPPRTGSSDCGSDTAMRVLRHFAPRGPCQDLRRLKATHLDALGQPTNRLAGHFWLQLGAALGMSGHPERLVEQWLTQSQRQSDSSAALRRIVREMDPHDAISLVLVEACQVGTACGAKLTNTSPRQFSRRVTAPGTGSA